MHEREPEEILKHARRLVAQGISVIPTGGGISPKAKQPHHSALKATGHHVEGKTGERRSSWRIFQERLPTAAELDTWYLTHRARGLGFVTGRLSGFIALDVDLEGIALSRTLGWRPHVITPKGGHHLYLRHPGWYVPSNASKNTAALPPGIDVRGDGGYCVYPPSRTRDGQYRRTEERQMLTIADIPEETEVGGRTYRLRAALGLDRPVIAPSLPPRRHSGTADPCVGDRVPVWLMLDRAASYAPTSRNRGAYMFGLWMNANGYTQEEALVFAGEYANRVNPLKTHAFTEDEAAVAITSAYRYPPTGPWTRKRE
ncbi:bifunctional DNA primase/polymerase [Deinococcus taklimakanensis]|uniref:Bifunctional DNA primase/polymerase n=1 Tax=Deinococcus taklimakanensis TaxID=536443 RepID=A0ABW5P640_9DEIO